MADVERALQMDADDVVELVLRHGDQGAVTQYPGVVHHDVEVTEVSHRVLDDGTSAVEARHALGVRNRFAASGGDLGNDDVGCARVNAVAVDIRAYVVDD